MDEHGEFLRYVQRYVTEKPEAAAYVSAYVAKGIYASQQNALERAADMEVALSVMIAKRYRGREELVLSKLKKWNNSSSLRWDDTISMLEGKFSSNQ